jgi:hypothetical protein
MNENSSGSIYYEAMWVLVLFAATATLREAFGELCVHSIAKTLMSCSHVSGKTLDVFISCSNGGRSLGFGAAWRMWNIDRQEVIRRHVVVLPFCCWIIGMPIKLVAVEAVRGGNEVLGYWGTWVVGILWISFCMIVKIFAIFVDKFHGMKDQDGKLWSYRKIFQARFCTMESYGMMIDPQEYDDTSFVKPHPNGPALGVDAKWTVKDNSKKLTMSLVRRSGFSDPTPNGIQDISKQAYSS